MKRFSGLILLLTLGGVILNAQFLSLADLSAICSHEKTVAAIEDLKSRGWVYVSSEADDETGINYETWSFAASYTEYVDEYSQADPVFISLISTGEVLNGVYYVVFDPWIYNEITGSLKKSGFRKTRLKDILPEGVKVWSDGKLVFFSDVQSIDDDDNPDASYLFYSIHIARLAGASGYGTDGHRKEYYPDGSLKSEYTIVDGKPDGLVRVYDREGFIVQESNYSHGRLHGTRKFWFPSVDENTGLEIEESGKLYLVSEYSRGQLHGTETWYYHASYSYYPCEVTDSSGHVSIDSCRKLLITRDLEVLNYKKDQLHGLYEKYDTQGDVIIRGYYRKGIMTGEWYYRDEEPDK